VIVVTGATGTVGSGILPVLAAAGEKVRAVSRRPPQDRIDRDRADRLEWFPADLADSKTLDGLADGADAIFLLPVGPGGPEQARNVLAQAERSGVGLIVSLSALSVGHGASDPISTWHRATEAVVTAGSVPWCVLRPGGFMSNTLRWADSIRQAGAVYAPYGHGRTAVIDPGDISACAVTCLLQPGHAGRTYELTGPQALSNGEQVQVISQATGREITYVEVSPEAARESMTSAGMPPEAADAVLGTLAAANSEFAAAVTDDVAATIGRPPGSFEHWVAQNQASFR
jgi:(4-alkanoyl-5-oxo-2,5-dihydrofuran-3-yl)methyl phosphate reductase